MESKSWTKKSLKSVLHFLSKNFFQEIDTLEKSKAKYYAKQCVEDQKEHLRYQDLLKKVSLFPQIN